MARKGEASAARGNAVRSATRCRAALPCQEHLVSPLHSAFDIRHSALLLPPSYERNLGHARRVELAADVATAFDYLIKAQKIDPARIVVVAAGTGCGVVERAMHEHKIAPAVVYLSPIFAPDDRDLGSAFAFRPDRPALVLASQEDTYAVRSLRAFETTFASDDDVKVKVYRSAGHGASILRDPANFAEVDAWIKQTVASTR